MQDPHATAIFVAFGFVAAVAVVTIPWPIIQAVVLCWSVCPALFPICTAPFHTRLNFVNNSTGSTSLIVDYLMLPWHPCQQP